MWWIIPVVGLGVVAAVVMSDDKKKPDGWSASDLAGVDVYRENGRCTKAKLVDRAALQQWVMGNMPWMQATHQLAATEPRAAVERVFAKFGCAGAEPVGFEFTALVERK